MAQNQAAVSFLTNIARAAFGLGTAATVLNSSLYTVDGGQRAVLFDRFRGVIDETVGEGTHFLVPWLQKPYIFDIRTRPHTFSSTSGAFDNTGLNFMVKLMKMDEEEQLHKDTDVTKDDESKSKNLSSETRKNKKRKRLLEEAAKAEKRGVCYLSRIPPRMDHVKLRHILSRHGEILRIYLQPEDPSALVRRKKAGGFRGLEFCEGWVEFADKRVAKWVAKMLNGERIGGKKKSSFYYDLWNIKYLRKFKWDDLTGEIATKNATREQKLALEISAAKRERDFYLAKVDQSRALRAINERLKKKQKVQQDAGVEDSELPGGQLVPKVVRHFPQNRPVTKKGGESKPRLSKEVLAGIFGGGS